MLDEPAKGWKVRELAEHADVKVSPGLVVKVRENLVQENYASSKHLLYLRDPVGLLENWARSYLGPAEQVPMYFLGEPAAAEDGGRRLVPRLNLDFALAGHSAAWR